MGREAKVSGLIYWKRFRWEVQSDFAEESEKPRRYIHVGEKDEKKTKQGQKQKSHFLSTVNS